MNLNRVFVFLSSITYYHFKISCIKSTLCSCKGSKSAFQFQVVCLKMCLCPVCLLVHICVHILVFMWYVHPPLSPCHIAFLCFQFPYYTLARNQMDLHEYKIHFSLFFSLILLNTFTHGHTQTSLKSFKCISQLPLRALFRICQGWKQT